MDTNMIRAGRCSICGLVREVLDDGTMPMHAPISRTRRRCGGSFLLPRQSWVSKAGQLVSYVDPRTGDPIPRVDAFDTHIRRRGR